MFKIEQKAHAERIFALLLQGSLGIAQVLPDDATVRSFAEKSIDFARIFTEASEGHH